MLHIIDFYRNLLKNNLDWLKTSLAWFGSSFVLGVFTFFAKPELLETIIQAFSERFGANPALNFDLAMQIFLQNSVASAVGLLGGLIFGLGSILVLVSNGFLIGYVVASIFYYSEGLLHSLALLIGGILPHGILELPAFLLAATLGLRLGMEWFLVSAKGKRREVLKNNLKQALQLLPLIAVILFIAAIVEVFVSGRIVDNL